MRAAAAAVALVGLTCVAASGQGRGADAAPFRGLHELEGVNTSVDEYTIWLYWQAEEWQAAYGPFLEEPENGADHEHPSGWITLTCRAAGKERDIVGPSGPNALLEWPRHRDQRDTYDIGHPLYWWLGVTGRETESYDAEVRVEDGVNTSVSRSEAVAPNTAYGYPRPETRMDVPARPVLEALRNGRKLTVEATGTRVRFSGRFGNEPELANAAAEMLAKCPSGRRQ